MQLVARSLHRITPSSVRQCMKRAAGAMSPQIGTHDGTFHCDEALGCFMLRRTAAFKDAPVVRTRAADKLAELDVVIDVGAVYVPENHRYDHHQKEFQDVFGHGFNTRLSSAGLVYKHFGKEIVAAELGRSEEDPVVHTVWLKVYQQFMEAVDGIDNGVNQYVSSEPARYESHTNLSSRVGRLNPNWNEEATPALSNALFEKAMALAGAEFLETVHYYGKVWLPGREPVERALASRKEVHPSGRVLKLPCYCPWKEHLYELEEEHKVSPLPLYVLYEDEKKQWRVQAISAAPGSFDSRKALPEAWRGLRDEQLSAVTGVPGGIFVHSSGFIGGCATEAGATAMAIAALSLA